MGAQNQVACPSPEMVGPECFVPAFPTHQERISVEVWAPCLCSQESCWSGEPVGVARAATSSWCWGPQGESPRQPAPEP